MSQALCPKSLWKKDANVVGTPSQNSFIVHAVLCSVQVCFSGWHVLAKVALNDGVNPIALAMAREACATLLMFFIARSDTHKAGSYAQFAVTVGALGRIDGKVALDPVHAGRISWMGVASCGNVVGCVLALSYFSPMAFGVMQPSIPIFSMILSYMCGLEQMSQLKCLGVVIAVFGSVWVELTSAPSAHDVVLESLEAPAGRGLLAGAISERALRAVAGGSMVGSLLLFWQCLSMAALMVLQKPLLSIYPPATLTAWYYAVGSGLTLILCAFLGVRPVDFWFTGHWKPWLALAYAVIVGTVYTYNAYSWVLNIVTPTMATTYLTLQPVTTVILSVIFLKVVIRGHEIFGGVMIAIGLIVTMYAKGLENRGNKLLLRARQNRELSRVFKTPRRHRFRKNAGIGNGSSGAMAGEYSNSDTDGNGIVYDDSDHDPLLGGVSGTGRGGYDPAESKRADGSLSRFLALV